MLSTQYALSRSILHTMHIQYATMNGIIMCRSCMIPKSSIQTNNKAGTILDYLVDKKTDGCTNKWMSVYKNNDKRS